MFYGSTKINNLNINIFRLNINMNRLNLLFFAFLISFMHNFFSEFNIIFLESCVFLFIAELISVRLFNRYVNTTNQQNQTNEDDDSSVSDIEDDNKVEDKTTTEEKGDKEVVEEKALEKKESSVETEEESDSEDSSDEPVDLTEGVDVSQVEILRLLNNYESLGDSGLMELKKKMLELDKLVEYYKSDTKKTKKE